ncbi:MAG: heme ABC transporter substrate-binding protein IsdE [Pseudobutyrivibrio sp.]|nr:heme ABC transporter substrate-binding protein IsdE [Pseudobutyrivibrio sp.]
MRYLTLSKTRFAAAIISASLMLTGCNGVLFNNTNQVEARAIDSSNVRIAATSAATMQICEALDLDLVGVPTSSLVEIPKRYKDATLLGSPMSPDMEILDSINPDWVLSPISLQQDLQPKYEAAGYNYAFLNLSSVEGMYQSIEDLGELFSKEEEAKKLKEDYETFMTEFNASHENKEGPSVLILMGLPGSYVVATENSYVGNLVKLAGGKNIYADEEDSFIAENTEDMLKKNPDIILRTAHALPDEVMEQFAEEFETNDIWKHFEAVQNDRVFDLNYSHFGMSANFEYQSALQDLDDIFYGDN